MDEVNVYLHDLNQGSLAIAKQVRMWGTRKVRLWVSEEALRQSSYKGLVANWRDGYVIDQSVQVDNSIGYYEWDLKTVGINPITSGGLKALIQRCWTQNLQFVILGEVAKIKNHFAGFVDAPQWPKLPDVWHVCEWVTTYEELLALCQQRGVFDFDLTNVSRFVRAGQGGQSETVYRELKTGNLIYLDRLHKTHYEVFDSHGKHLGEMSLNGYLDRTKSDSNKRLNVS